MGKISLHLPFKIVLNGSKLKSGSPNFNQNVFIGVFIFCVWNSRDGFDLFICPTIFPGSTKVEYNWPMYRIHHMISLSVCQEQTKGSYYVTFQKKKSCKILVVIFRFSIQLVFKRVNTSLASLGWFMRYLPIHFNIILRYFLPLYTEKVACGQNIYTVKPLCKSFKQVV